LSTPYSISADDRLGNVVDAFKANFEDGLELGASVFALQDGDVILDLKGGWADKEKTEPVNDRHLFSVYSTGKAAAALVIAHLADQDRLGYDQPVSTFWPEFAARGKGELTIGQVMSHQHGLSGITNPQWSPEGWYDWDKTVAELAAQKPIFEPGTASGYSPITYGFLAGEIAWRTDKFGRNLGEILRQDICEPHGIDVWLGLPDIEHHRSVYMQKPRRLAKFGEITPALRAAFLEKWSATAGPDVTVWRKAQLAGSNCQATAKGMARLMQAYVDGSINGSVYLAEDMVEKATRTRITGQDQVLPFELNIAAGVMVNYPNFFYGPNPSTVGHSGWGGSCTFADPDAGLSFCYAMNRQENSLMGDPRTLRIIEALYDAL